jgi:RNA polymerase sigma-70 factor (ECF subfamily)
MAAGESVDGAARSNQPSQDAELSDLIARHHEQLRRMVQLRLDRRLQARVAASDVLQEAFLEAALRYDEYRRGSSMSPLLWLRFIVGQRLLLLHRKHMGVKARDAGRDVSLYRGALPEATSQTLAAQLLGRNTSPSNAAMRAELQMRLQEMLNGMDEIDREVLVLRHFEQLSNVEAAEVLGIQERAASNRYIRALRRLKDILSTVPGLLDQE